MYENLLGSKTTAYEGYRNSYEILVPGSKVFISRCREL